jgi:hypothetical protein
VQAETDFTRTLTTNPRASHPVRSAEIHLLRRLQRKRSVSTSGRSVGGCGRWPIVDTYVSLHLGNKWTLRNGQLLRGCPRDDGGRWERCAGSSNRLCSRASVARVAQAPGVNANQVFSWRRQYRQGLLSQRNAQPVQLLPVHVSEALANKANRPGSRQDTAAEAGTIGGISQGTCMRLKQCGWRSTAHCAGAFAAMIGLAAGTRIWIVAGVTDMRRADLRG